MSYVCLGNLQSSARNKLHVKFWKKNWGKKGLNMGLGVSLVFSLIYTTLVEQKPFKVGRTGPGGFPGSAHITL